MVSKWLLMLCVGAAGCDCGGAETTSGGVPSAPAGEPTHVDPRTRVLVDVDRRELSEALREAARSPDVALRRLAVLGVARLHDPNAVPILLDGLRDPDAEVRRHASLGLGAFEDEAAEGINVALLGALAAEADRETRAAILTDLGRVAGDEALAAFREALAGNEPEVRAAACTGLGSYGLRNRALDPALVRRIAARMVDDTTPEVRLACSYALTRLAPPVDAPAEARGIVDDIARAAADEDPEVRAMAVRALGRYPAPPIDVLVARTQDADWIVAVQAFRSLARVPSAAPAYARALAARVDRALGVAIAGPELHVLLTALEAAAPLAREAPIEPVAANALDRLSEPVAPADRDRGLAHCAAAGLVDRGRGWPTRTTECGLGKVDEEERRVMMAAVVAELDGSAPERVTLIERLFREGGPRAKQAALAAAPTLDPVAVAPTVLAGLRARDPGVITAAADAVIALAPKWRAPPADTAPVLSVRPAGEAPPPQAPRPAGPATGQLTRALRAAGNRLRADDEVEGLQSWARAVAAAEARGLADPLGELVHHPAAPVRSAATAALRALGVEAPAGERRAVGNPIDPASLPAQDEAVRAVISTDRGDIELLLETAHAPTTVARFRELARADFYDGLTFHRVVPAFVVQGGDPRGDGYGGPGWTQRCEDSRLEYRRGTVGMALAGRDTGGSQLFIAHSAQPHLENRYTAFARVVRGMEVVDALQVGDRIRDVRITEDDS